jgi:phosphatidylserine/phosphatidylglycerophosphate/cardiolipin synthase-like enzyme
MADPHHVDPQRRSEEYPDRDIATRGSALVPQDFLQSLFVAELLWPSQRLWISSPWISDVELIDNTARQFSSLNPDWPAARIRLSAVLAALLERGAEVILITNRSPHNEDFFARMAPLERLYGKRLRIIKAANLHEKGILSDTFTLNGSMNLTYGGVYCNEEYLIYRCDPARVAERRVTLEDRWREQLCS